LTHCRPRMCSATGCSVAEWLAYTLTGPPKFDILHPVPAFGGGPNAIRSIETARFHHAARWRGSRVAARGARAAARSGAADWHSDAASLDGPPVESSFAAVTTWVNRSDFEEEHGDDDLLDRRSQPP